MVNLRQTNTAVQKLSSYFGWNTSCWLVEVDSSAGQTTDEKRSCSAHAEKRHSRKSGVSELSQQWGQRAGMRAHSRDKRRTLALRDRARPRRFFAFSAKYASRLSVFKLRRMKNWSYLTSAFWPNPHLRPRRYLKAQNISRFQQPLISRRLKTGVTSCLLMNFTIQNAGPAADFIATAHQPRGDCSINILHFGWDTVRS